MLIGGGMLMSEFTSCSSQPAYKAAIRDNTLTVPLSLFAESDLQIIQPENFGYNIALKKGTDGSFNALVLRCTHADNPLTYAGNDYRCTLHGSRFDIEGEVTRGPAQISLQHLRTKLTGDTISIFLR
jgi:Rieske Fe-S protein